MAKAFVAETRGVFEPRWTAEELAARMPEISDRADPLLFAPLPRGSYDHLGTSFAMASRD